MIFETNVGAEGRGGNRIRLERWDATREVSRATLRCSEFLLRVTENSGKIGWFIAEREKERERKKEKDGEIPLGGYVMT